MGKIRRNALNYSVKYYAEILLENLDTISDTKEKFQKYRELVRSRVKKLEEEGVQISRRTVAKYRMQMEIPDASGRKAE